MRQFDTLQSYLDNRGNVFIGKAVFCDTNGVPSNIYDSDLHLMDSSSVFTDSAGRLERQVFLEDKDYLVRFYRYIGNTSMTDDDSDDVWEFNGECKDLFKVFDIDVDTVGIQGVQSIAELRVLDPVTVESESGSRYINLLGYNKAGDKPMVTYRWEPNAVADDDGGSVIAVDGVAYGRWVMVDGLESLDVRHFGIFPNLVPMEDSFHRINMPKVTTYAKVKGLKVSFVGAGYYDVSGATIDAPYVGLKSCLVGCHGSTVTLSNVEQVYCYGDDDFDGTFNVYGTELRTSFNRFSYSNVKLHPSVRIVLDTDMYHRYSDVEVVVDVEQTSGCSFERCTFVGDKKIGGPNNVYSFTGCRLAERNLNYEVDATFMFSDCRTERVDWTSVNRYVDFMLANGASVLDLGMGTYSGNIEFAGDAIVTNGTIDGNVVAGGTIRLESVNVTGTISLNNAQGDVILRFSSVKMEGVANILYADNSYVSGNVTFANAICNNTRFLDSLKISVQQQTSDFFIMNCTFAGSSNIAIRGPRYEDPSNYVKVYGKCAFNTYSGATLITSYFVNIDGINVVDSRITNVTEVETYLLRYTFKSGTILVNDKPEGDFVNLPDSGAVAPYSQEIIVVNNTSEDVKVSVGSGRHSRGFVRDVYVLVPKYQSATFVGQRTGAKKIESSTKDLIEVTQSWFTNLPIRCGSWF